MPSGLQVWNAAGALVFDTPDRMSRIIGITTIGATDSGSIALPTGMGDYWWFTFPSDGTGFYTPVITVSGSMLSYNPATIFGPAKDCTLIYGVY